MKNRCLLLSWYSKPLQDHLCLSTTTLSHQYPMHLIRGRHHNSKDPLDSTTRDLALPAGFVEDKAMPKETAGPDPVNAPEMTTDRAKVDLDLMTIEGPRIDPDLMTIKDHMMNPGTRTKDIKNQDHRIVLALPAPLLSLPSLFLSPLDLSLMSWLASWCQIPAPSTF
ncbi:hypothetical protein GDO81_010880 [Engystomops pustulosus]|uniref:Uncharacterized protein n=1 Tax=Engystomops pustulosus TaxID=76066 RepID=A0AAV7C3Z9_ENGPU|nr:hypothetical protein GDO81_010880 [Engystomops pustulosus]